MDTSPLRVLIIEDDAVTRRAVARALAGGGEAVEVRQAENGRDGLKALLAEPFDCAFLDYRLPEKDGAAVLREARQAGVETPIIILTARGSEQIAVELMKSGAADYLSKSQLAPEMLWSSLRSAVRVGRAEAAARQANRLLAENEERLKRVLETNVDGIAILDRNGRFLFMNPAAERIVGATLDELNRSGCTYANPPWEVLHLDETPVPQSQRSFSRVMSSGQPVYAVESVIRRRDGSRVVVSINSAPLRESDGSIGGMVSSLRDITERMAIEQARGRERNFVATVLDTVGSIVLVLDCEGRIIRCNKATERITGIRADQLQGRMVWTLLPEDQVEPARAALNRVIRTGAVVEHEGAIRCADGSLRNIQWSGATIGGDGESFIIATGADVTERLQAETALREAEHRYRTLFEESPFGVIVGDPVDCSIVNFNATAHRQLGYSREEFARFKLADLRADHDSVAVWALMRRLLQEGAIEFESRHLARNGDVRDMLISARTLIVGGRTVAQATVQDVTERNRLKEQLLQSQKMEAIGLLAGGVAHDFNNLLAVISGYSESLLRRIPEGDRLRGHIEEIQRASDRGGSLTRQLLAFSRRQAASPQPVCLNEIISSMQEMLRRVAPREIKLSLRLHPTLPLVRADMGQMEQVVLNLAINARDAMPDGGTLSISTTTRQLVASMSTVMGLKAGIYVALSVGDTGGGMDAHTQAHIFEPFFTTKNKGTGLGLSIVYGIVRGCGGIITVNSRVDEGSTFEVLLPALADGVET